MTVPLVIGGPVHRRAWCLDRWFDAVEAQDLPDGTRYLFALSEPGDPSEAVILRRAPQAEVLYVEGLPALGDPGRYDDRRHVVLATIRNRILRALASIAPEYFWSLDSDILMAPGSLGAMRSLGKDAVGALLDMGSEAKPGHWSWMRFDPSDPNWAYRPEGPQPIVPQPVDVIMGSKLMTARTYRNVRYADHLLGEDVGWALQCRAMRVERWICPAATGEHLYDPSVGAPLPEPEAEAT